MAKKKATKRAKKRSAVKDLSAKSASSVKGGSAGSAVTTTVPDVFRTVKL